MGAARVPVAPGDKDKTLMTAAIELRPGVTALADWRAIYRGAAVTVNPVARVDVEAGRIALTDLLARNGLFTSRDASDASPSIAELVEKGGEPLPNGILRLFVALKLASLAQGTSGMRWGVIEALAAFQARDLLPVVTAENASDRIALARLFGALTGTGEALGNGRIVPAQKALKAAELAPLSLNARERAALLSGTQLTVAAALAGLFEAERVLQSAVVAAALSALGQAGAADPPGVHRLHRQRGQIEVAAAFRHLLPDAAAAARTPADDSLDRDPIRLGACLDLLHCAGGMLECAANSVSEDRVVLWQSEEIVNGVGDLSSVALAGDLIALALQTVGDLAEARMASIAAPRLPKEPAANENATGLQARATAFVAENRDRARPSGFQPEGVWRLLPMAGTTALIVAIEVLEAVHTAEGFLGSVPPGLDAVLLRVREVARETGALAATNLASVAALVGSGALVSAARVQLPSLAPPPAERHAARLGGRAKRT